jgi:hypothetical protein
VFFLLRRRDVERRVPLVMMGMALMSLRVYVPTKQGDMDEVVAAVVAAVVVVRMRVQEGVGPE